MLLKQTKFGQLYKIHLYFLKRKQYRGILSFKDKCWAHLLSLTQECATKSHLLFASNSRTHLTSKIFVQCKAVVYLKGFLFSLSGLTFRSNFHILYFSILC